MFQTKVAEEVKTHILYSTFLTVPLYGIMWKNSVQQDSADGNIIGAFALSSG
jgi:hypothetical protein